MRRRCWLPATRLCAAAPVAVILALVAPVPATAAAPSGSISALQSGYWWMSQPDGAPLPPPPQVPQGGLWVASNAAGSQAVAAVRFTLADGVSAPVLVLAVHQAQPAAQVSIVACNTTSPWKPPGTAGSWSARPTPDCTAGSVPGALSSDGSTMRFDLSGLATSQTVSVVLQPAAVANPASAVPGSPAQISPTFDATFEAVAPSAVQTTGSPTPTSLPASPDGSSSDSSGSLASPPLSGSPDQGSSLALGPPAELSPALPTGQGSLGPLPTVAPTVVNGPTTRSSTPAPVALGPQAAAGIATPGKHLDARGRWVLLLVLVDLVGFAWYEQRRGLLALPRLTLNDVPPPGGRPRVAEDQGRRRGAPEPLR